MSAEYFLDTNVLVYSFDKSAPAKREKSVNLIAEGLRKGSGAISWQVVASALQCGARVLFSEDLQDGRRFDELEIRNPFAE